MSGFVQFTVIGTLIGCVYAIAASGLVLTYTTTGVFNFAHGAVGMLAAYLFYTLRVDMELATPLALLVVLFVLTPLLALVVERLVMRRFRHAEVGTTLVVTLALTIGLLGAVEAAYDPQEARNLPLLFGNHTLDVAGVAITWDQASFLVVAAVVAVGLRLFLRHTQLGVAMRGVVDDPELAALNGANPDRVAQAAWVLGFFLAALAGILFAGGRPLSAVVLAFLVLNAYSAAMVGRLRNLPMTAAGALALGLLQAWTNLGIYPDGDLWRRLALAVPGLFLIAVLVALPRVRLRTGNVVRRRLPPVPSLRGSLGRAVAFVAVAALLGHLFQENLVDLTRAVVLGITMLSFTLLTGYGGQISLGQMLFVGTGAWVMGSVAGGDSIVGLLLAGAVAAPLGALAALPALRLTGLSLALATFALALIGQRLLFGDPRVLGTDSVAVGRLQVAGLDFGSGYAFFLLSVAAFALLGVAVLGVRRSQFGRRLAAMRDSEAACATLGLDVRVTKLVLFMGSAAIAGVGGAFFGGFNRVVSDIDFQPLQGLVLFLFAYVGGISTVSGALLGGGLFALLGYVQSALPGLAGAVFVVVAAAAVALGRAPNGLTGTAALWLDDWARTPRAGPGEPAEEQEPGAVEAKPAMGVMS